MTHKYKKIYNELSRFDKALRETMFGVMLEASKLNDEVIRIRVDNITKLLDDAHELTIELGQDIIEEVMEQKE